MCEDYELITKGLISERVENSEIILEDKESGRDVQQLCF